MKGGDNRQQDQGRFFTLLQVAQDTVKHQDGPETFKGFIAGIAAVEKQNGRDEQHCPCKQSPAPAQVTPEKQHPGRNRSNGEDRIRRAGAEIAIAE